MQKKKLHFTTYLICQRKTSKKNIKRPLDHIHVNSCNWQDPVGIQKTEHLVNIALSLMTIKLTGRNINRVMGVEWTNKEHLLNIAWLFLYICRGSLCLDNNLSIVISCRVYLHTFFFVFGQIEILLVIIILNYLFIYLCLFCKLKIIFQYPIFMIVIFYCLCTCIFKTFKIYILIEVYLTHNTILFSDA